jgi:hypothetical protein
MVMDLEPLLAPADLIPVGPLVPARRLRYNSFPLKRRSRLVAWSQRVRLPTSSNDRSTPASGLIQVNRPGRVDEDVAILAQRPKTCAEPVANTPSTWPGS